MLGFNTWKVEKPVLAESFASTAKIFWWEVFRFFPWGRDVSEFLCPNFTQGDLLRLDWTFGQIPGGFLGWPPGGSR